MATSWYSIKALDDAPAQIYIYGDIVSEKWDETEVTAKDFIDELNALDVSDIDLHINSPGGAVFQASAIYTAILRHKAQVTAYIDGVAASAATLPAMAADYVVMSDAATFMIHNPWLMLAVAGDVHDVRRASEQTIAMLDSAKESMISAYERKSKLSRQEIWDAMDAETWYTAEQAVAAGFADDIFTGHKMAAMVPPGRYKNAPEPFVHESQRSGGNDTMTTQNLPGAGVPPTDENEADKVNAMKITEIETAARKKALDEDRARRDGIGAIFARFPQYSDLCRQAQDDLDCTPEIASVRLLDALGKESAPIGGNVRIETGEDEQDKFRRHAVDALSARIHRQALPAGADGRLVSFRKLAARCLELGGMKRADIDAMRDQELIKAALVTHSTSDFPNILENTMHKEIVSAYTAFPRTWSQWCRTGSVSDFRAHRRLKIGSFSNLTTVNEAGEYESGTIPDAESETQTATTKGREIRISRQTFVNDDLQAFADLGQSMGRSAARTVEVDVYAALVANAALADGTAFFHADHGNLAASGAAVSVATLSAGEDAMRSQTDPGGTEIIDVRPAIFLGGLAAARTAMEVIGSEFTPEIASATRASRRRNALFGMIPEDNIIGTPRVAGLLWYLFADPADVPAFEVAFLDGVTEPFIDSMETLNPDGVRMLVRLDYGVAGIDQRGGYKNPGS